ncbi:DUF2971 domain-containing protein [Microbulbifer discodermiae]|uniref:DUF2971 domain-containing protein n=1 Tax=Microbulbifer sp. 2201CG32-9 TaxID=3232309 RepID=UPI00345C3A62
MANKVILDQDLIFKYGKLDYLQTTISESTLKFSNATEFNDSFENKYQLRISRSRRPIDIYDFGRARSVYEEIKEHLERTKICCFSKDPTLPLMWAHYAANHTGVCYCFKQGDLFDSKSYKSDQVRYSSVPPKIYVIENETRKFSLKKQIFDTILTKSSVWQYEQELRFFLESKDSIHHYDRGALEAVILGCKMDNESIAKTTEFIREHNKKKGASVSVYHAVESEDFYELKIFEKNIKKDRFYSDFFDEVPPLVMPEQIGSDESAMVD